ncbi:Uncharacterized protein ALO94_05583 [Pseudomonas syringae pv. spinaceae]|uniref:Uncharacterized protein n=1 Tax=Pseudomonas syringae pv. spinaceae TaxID=264459 RepID=A0A0Q0A799_PSESX|nr:Uncharacterized protein ALO94_05583 [Pseudomonas syringae pv. spinaceae]
MARCDQTLTVTAVGDEPGFNQNRRHIRRFEHRESGLFHTLLVQRGDAFQAAQYRVTQLQTGGDGGVHRHVENHPGKHRVLVLEVEQRRRAQQVRTVFPLRHEARGCRRGAAFGQREHRSTGRRQTRRGVGVHGDEHVGIGFMRELDTLAQRHKEIVIAHQAHIKTLLALQAFGQQLGDRQHHIFLALATRPDSTWVLAAMTGVDHHHDVAAGARFALDGNRHGRRQLGHLYRRTSRGTHVQHQPVTLPAFRAEQEAVELHRRSQVQHDARVIARAVMTGTNRFDNRAIQRQLAEIASQPRTADINDQTVGRSQREGFVLHRAAQVEHQPQLVVGPPKACITDLRSVHAKRQRQGGAGQQHIEQHLTSVHGMSQRANRASRLMKGSST